MKSNTPPLSPLTPPRPPTHHHHSKEEHLGSRTFVREGEVGGGGKGGEGGEAIYLSVAASTVAAAVLLAPKGDV